jgi:hypothetical protein
MGKKSVRSISIVAKEGKIYDIDKMSESNTRSDSSKPFVLHIKLYNPLSKNKAIKSVIPEDVKIGST